MSSQPALFYEDIYDALRGAVQACGGAKEVARALWPQKSVEDGRRELLDCLNRNRPRKLDPEEVMFVLRLARLANFHAGINFFCGEIGYSVQALEPADELAELQRQYISSVELQRHIADRMERLVRAPLAVAK